MNFETYPFEKLNNLLENITPNPEFSALSLTIGEPQFDTPSFILEALNKHASTLNKYPKTAGESELREGMLQYLKNRFELELDNTQIIPTFGTREVLFNFPQFLLHDIDEPVMVFPNPFYQIYEGAAKASRAEVVYLNLNEAGDFQPVIDEKALSRANFVILNSPNNPTSSVMSMEQMKQWVELALKYDFVLLNDECYADLYLDDPIPSLLNASIEAGNGAFKNVLVINSISKRSSAPGREARGRPALELGARRREDPPERLTLRQRYVCGSARNQGQLRPSRSSAPRAPRWADRIPASMPLARWHDARCL